MTADMRALFAREWQDIAAGRYPAPRPLSRDPGDFLRRSSLYFRDLPQVDARRHGKLDDELPPGNQADGLPDYYRQNFHFQSDGWLSERSAALYDTQVEVLFTGSADVMRRRALRPIAEWMAGRNQRSLRGLDVGCGTGRLLAFLHQAWPGLKWTGLDLSPPYLAEARRLIGDTARVKLIEGAAEKLPFEDASLDLVVSSFLLHELPAEIRGKALAEMARVLRPGMIHEGVLSAALGADLVKGTSVQNQVREPARSPGQLAKHYSPKAKIILAILAKSLYSVNHTVRRPPWQR